MDTDMITTFTHSPCHVPQLAMPSLARSLHALLQASSYLAAHPEELSMALSFQHVDMEPIPQPMDAPGGHYPSGLLHAPPLPLTHRNVMVEQHSLTEDLLITYQCLCWTQNLTS